MFIPDIDFFTHPESRDQTGTRSRIRIRNTGYDYNSESMRTLPAVGDRRVEPEEQPHDEQRGEYDPGQETGNPGRKQTCQNKHLLLYGQETGNPGRKQTCQNKHLLLYGQETGNSGRKQT